MASYEDSETPRWSKEDAEQSLLSNNERSTSTSQARNHPGILLGPKHYILLGLSFLFISLTSGFSVYVLMSLTQLKSLHNMDPHADASLSTVDQTYQKLHTYTDFSSPDDAVSAAAWDRYVVNGFVALPHAWARDRGWPLGRDMPGDGEKGIYVVDGFHQLHCLMSLRTETLAIIDGAPVKNLTHTKRHLNHCYDALRQAIICRADPTPLYVPKDTFFAGDGQERQSSDEESRKGWLISLKDVIEIGGAYIYTLKAFVFVYHQSKYRGNAIKAKQKR
ncbi:hypothetical protein EYC84_002568 [Monilinia fructicola]|uniref:DUF3328 domain-containing protein n=1 Tax=Monilinia fructicola TaxID=38448 RepID=A0A5M9JR11_MONFR|nr:hypothetical protein EYC84_002568 [Monilinia fructicola]